MLSYKLEKNQDADFLNSLPVICKVTFTKSQYEKEPPQPGVRIVVVLSNNKKYNGLIKEVNLKKQDQYLSGEITLIRLLSLNQL